MAEQNETLFCKHCNGALTVHQFKPQFLRCKHCGLLHNNGGLGSMNKDRGTPYGWLVEIGGFPGGTITLEDIRHVQEEYGGSSLLKQHDIATIVRVAAQVTLRRINLTQAIFQQLIEE